MDKELTSLLEGIETASNIQQYDEGFWGGVKGAIKGAFNGQGVKAGAAAGSAQQNANNAQKSAQKANKDQEKQNQANQNKADTELLKSVTAFCAAPQPKLNGKVLGPNDIMELIKNGDEGSLEKVETDKKDDLKELTQKASENAQQSKKPEGGEAKPAQNGVTANIGDKANDPNWQFILQVLNKKLSEPAGDNAGNNGGGNGQA